MTFGRKNSFIPLDRPELGVKFYSREDVRAIQSDPEHYKEVENAVNVFNSNPLRRDIFNHHSERKYRRKPPYHLTLPEGVVAGERVLELVEAATASELLRRENDRWVEVPFEKLESNSDGVEEMRYGFGFEVVASVDSAVSIASNRDTDAVIELLHNLNKTNRALGFVILTEHAQDDPSERLARLRAGVSQLTVPSMAIVTLAERSSPLEGEEELPGSEPSGKADTGAWDALG